MRGNDPVPTDDRGEPRPPLLQRICAAGLDGLPITGASVSVMTAGGHRGIVHASGDTARRLEELQFTVGEGPGVDAFTGNRLVQVADLAASGVPAWSAFRPAATALGVRSVAAFPLHLGAACLGVLTVHSIQAGMLGAAELALALRLADSAAFALLDLLAGTESTPDGDGHAVDALSGDTDFYRAEVYQASGLIMVQLAVTIEVAMVRLRAYAYAQNRPIGEVARDIVRRKLHLEDDNE